jgi:hypothetical protein
MRLLAPHRLRNVVVVVVVLVLAVVLVLIVPTFLISAV